MEQSWHVRPWHRRFLTGFDQSVSILDRDSGNIGFRCDVGEGRRPVQFHTGAIARRKKGQGEIFVVSFVLSINLPPKAELVALMLVVGGLAIRLRRGKVATP